MKPLTALAGLLALTALVVAPSASTAAVGKNTARKIGLKKAHKVAAHNLPAGWHTYHFRLSRGPSRSPGPSGVLSLMTFQWTYANHNPSIPVLDATGEILSKGDCELILGVGGRHPHVAYKTFDCSGEVRIHEGPGSLARAAQAVTKAVQKPPCRHTFQGQPLRGARTCIYRLVAGKRFYFPRHSYPFFITYFTVSPSDGVIPADVSVPADERRPWQIWSSTGKLIGHKYGNSPRQWTMYVIPKRTLYVQLADASSRYPHGIGGPR